MAEECGESCSVETPTSTMPPSNWWDLHGSSALSHWSNMPWNHHVAPNLNPNSNSDEDVSISTSFTNASNHSGLTVESSRRLVEPAGSSTADDLIGPDRHHDSQIWSHAFLNVGSGALQRQQEEGENFLDMLSSSKSIYELPACDYLKKLGTSPPNNKWDHFSTSPNLINHNTNFMHPDPTERLSKLSNLISTWSIAPPEPPELVTPQISLNCTLLDHNNYPPSPTNNLCSLLKHGASFGSAGNMETGPAATGDMGKRSFNGFSNTAGFNRSSNIIDDTSMDSYAKSFADIISFSGRLDKPLIDIHGFNDGNKSSGTTVKPVKQRLQTTSPPTRSNGRGHGNASSEGKKKRSEDSNNSETSVKKSKNESSTASSTKMQAPKVKLGERITALQQIVSPFGKTDTASVLFEAIQYIKFLQEQVQLLSNPYMKTNSLKDPWDRKTGHHQYHQADLRSRGLCLVPVACTPQAYRENTGSDYWTPTYRGCMYR